MEGLSFLGLELDPEANRAGGPVVSSGTSAVAVLVVATDEESVIASLATEVARGLKVRAS